MSKFWYQTFIEDWNTPQIRTLSLEAKGLLGEMERLAVQGKPIGHVTWPNGDAIDVSSLAILSNVTSEQVTKILSDLESRGVIGTSKSGAYAIMHLLKRENLRKKRAKTGKIGGVVTQCKIRENSGLLKQNLEFAKALETKSKSKETKNYYFDGEVIKLNQGDYTAWRELSGKPDESFWKWLSERDSWYQKDGANYAPNWFRATSLAAEKLRFGA